jgi:poly-gamma-glutamate capsule biosynthesis protein CapA/YwtB (metallophosphatase superfamily)
MLKAIIISLMLYQSTALNPTDMYKPYFSAFLQKEEPITITFAGDTLMDWSVKEAINKHGPQFPFVHVKEQVKSADYAILNLESAVTTKNTPFPKIYNFKADPIALKGVKDAGFDLVTLANNHAMDYKEEGLVDTINHLKNYELHYIGAGSNDEEAYAPHRISIKNKNISFLNFSHVLPAVSWYAQPNKPGLASGYQLERMLELIEKEKGVSDFVFVIIHWGKEKMNKPVYYQETYGKAMVDAGADGIIGHHPHWLQGFEYYKGKPIAYSLGNFLFPDYVTGKTAETGLFTLEINNEEIKSKFTPYNIKNNQIVKLDQKSEIEALQYLQSISFGVKFEGQNIIPLKK